MENNTFSQIPFPKKLPPIGMRIIKSTIGVGLCFLIYLLRGKQGEPFYSALAVLWCIQNHTEDALENAVQRVIGTGMGTFYGLLYILFNFYLLDLGESFLHYTIISLLIIPVIYTAVLFHQKDTAFFSCSVFLSIVIYHLEDVHPYIYVFNRSFDTIIGIGVGLLISIVPLHLRKRKDALFVVNLDHALNQTSNRLTPFSLITLQNLIKDGISLTIHTSQTPATCLDVYRELPLTIPLITLDGALLYNAATNTFPFVYVISGERADKVSNFVRNRGFRIFTTVILDDVLIIYHDELLTDVEIDLYNRLKSSPYRNYLNKKHSHRESIVYFMVIEKHDRILELYRMLEICNVTDELKVVITPSKRYDEYSYLRIYNKNASVENMVDHLKAKMGYKTVVSVDENNSAYSHISNAPEADKIVRYLRKLYYSTKE
ncbi:MAG: FUSC family protein [Lachnospiraceae bacterium]|nr:FUSC family protein [Lachnospiraceae bacterium]